MNQFSLFNDIRVSCPGLVRRLADGVIEAKREISSDPRSYLKTALGFGGLVDRRRRARLRLGLVLALVAYSLAALVTVMLWTVNQRGHSIAAGSETIHWLKYAGRLERQPSPPDAGGKEAGGGGGGNNNPLPPSQGPLPRGSLDLGLIAPTTRLTLRPPVLPVPETILVDPRLLPQATNGPTGLPDGVVGPPSDGPGSNGGIGTGTDGGIGPGQGPGNGPGSGGNKGNGSKEIGGPPQDSGPPATRPLALNRPQPRYTEEARRQRIEGTVLAKVLVGADGSVREIRVTRGLPAGLTEEAVTAAKAMKFNPATKGGRPVPSWVNLEITFTLR